MEPQSGNDATSDEGRAFRSLSKAVRIRRDRFAFDVRNARKAMPTAANYQLFDLSDGNLDLLSGFVSGCRLADEGSGRLVPVRYGGQAGVLVFRQPQGDSQVVDLYLCGYDDVVRTVTLSHP